MYRYIVGMNYRYCNDNVLGMYGSIVGNEGVSVRKKQQRKTKSVIYIIVKPCWLLWNKKKENADTTDSDVLLCSSYRSGAIAGIVPVLFNDLF